MAKLKMSSYERAEAIIEKVRELNSLIVAAPKDKMEVRLEIVGCTIECDIYELRDPVKEAKKDAAHIRRLLAKAKKAKR